MMFSRNRFFLAVLVLLTVFSTVLPAVSVFATGTTLIDDDSSSLAGAGWSRSNQPRADNYITDSPNSLGNPNNVHMKTALRGEYLFYSAANNMSSYLTKHISIGSGTWYAEFNTRFFDLSTPSANHIWRGFAIDITANGKRYRLVFNSMDANGNIHILLMNSASGAFYEKIVNVKLNNPIHKWGIAFDGDDTVRVSMDNSVILKYLNINIQTGSTDGVDIYNNSEDLLAGTNYIVLYNFKLVSNQSPVWTENSIDDSCISLNSSGWDATAPRQGVYVTDHSHSTGNPDNISLKDTPNGKYLFYGDSTAVNPNYCTMYKSVSIGNGPWTLKFNARFVDLITPASNFAVTGLSFEVTANQKQYKITFNDDNKILAVKSSCDGSYSKTEVKIPTDINYHIWEIWYDGKDRVFVGIDGRKIAEFDNMGVSTTDNDGVNIINNSLNTQSGTTEVYIDSIMLTNGKSPDWTQSDPYFTGNYNVIFTDYCSNLKAAGWTRSSAPANGNYISDFSSSLGNPNNIQMQKVQQDQYILCNSAGNSSSSISKSLSIGPGPWYVEFDACFPNLLTPSANPAWRGFAVDVFANSKRFRVNFNSKDASGNIKIQILKSASQYDEAQVKIPEADKMHHWGIGFDGADNVAVTLDDSVVARFQGINLFATQADSIEICNSAYDLQSGSNLIYMDYLRVSQNYAPDWAFEAFNDSCDNLKNESWTRSSLPAVGNYITDQPNSLGNPDDIQMISAPQGQYLFYGSANNTICSISRTANIGSGPWYIEFQARMEDLATPSANQAWRGFSLDVYANLKRYRINFNSKNSNGDIKIQVLKDGTNYQECQVNIPDFSILHQWDIAFDGNSTIIVALNGKEVGAFTGINWQTSLSDRIEINNVQYDLQSGTNKVFIDYIKLLRKACPIIVQKVIDDDCSSISNAGWSADIPLNGVYITDNPTSLGNPHNASLKPVAAGKYIVYGDNTAAEGNYVGMSKNIDIGSGVWTLRFDACFVDLVKPSANQAWRGLQFIVNAGRKCYRFTFNDDNKLLVLTTNGGQYIQQQLNMPSDGQYHAWEIVFAGNGNVLVGLDGNKIAKFEDVGIDTTSTDSLTIMNDTIDDYQSGSTEVYFDRIDFRKNYIPAWAGYEPHFSGISILPVSNSQNIYVAANVVDMDSGELSSGNVYIQADLYNGEQLVSTTTQNLTQASTTLNINAQQNTGFCKIDFKLLNGNMILDETNRNVELFSTVQTITPNQNITSSAGTIYLFTQMDQMKDADGNYPGTCGWTVTSFNYKGSDSSGCMIENQNNANVLTLPVNLSGWFGVYIGYIAGGTQEFDVSDGNIFKNVKFESYATGNDYGEQTISEEFVTAADFNGRTFSIIPTTGKKARIAYIRLRGLSSSDVAEYTLQDEGTLGKRVIYNNDGCSDFFSGDYHSIASLKSNAVDIYANQDVGQVDFCLLTTMQLNYDSQYAGMPFDTFGEDEISLREGDLIEKNELLDILYYGQNALEVVTQRAHELNMKCNASLRMDAFYNPAVDPVFNGKIYNDYLGYRYIDKSGSTRDNMSYAYPSFRTYIKNILTEVAAMPNVDGVNLDFCRYPNLIGYEPVLTQPYYQQYGIYPQNETTSEGINRWNQYKSNVLTQMMREIRAELIGKDITVRVPPENCLSYGLDISAWVAEGLIDTLIISPMDADTSYDISPYAAMVSGTNIKLYAGVEYNKTGHDLTKEEEDLLSRGISLNLSATNLSRVEYLKWAYDMYNEGADGLYIFNNWDGNHNIIGLLGDKVKVGKWYYFDYPSEFIKNPVIINEP